jgi:hypothetical protein
MIRGIRSQSRCGNEFLQREITDGWYFLSIGMKAEKVMRLTMMARTVGKYKYRTGRVAKKIM